MKDYSKWLKAFMDSWKKLEGVKTCDLIADKCQYFENPIDDPCTSKEEIKKLWEIGRASCRERVSTTV